MSAEGPRPRQARAWASVLAAVVAPTMMRVVAAAGSLFQVIVGTSAGIEGVACIMVVAETLTHRDRGALPTSLWLLVDRRIPVGALRGRAMSGVKLVSPRQRVLGLLRHRTLEQRSNLMMGPTILGRCGL